MGENLTQETKTRQTLWQAVKFTLFSASAGMIQVAAFAVLHDALHLVYWISYGVALVLSVLWNFTFNRRYTFRSDMNIPRAMGLVFLYYLVFTPLSTWAGAALATESNDYLVLIGTMLVNFITEYLYQRFVVYGKSIDTNDLARKAQAEKEA